MAATHDRRKKSEMRLESVTCTLTSIPELFVNASLTTGEVIVKILSQSGPHSPSEIHKKCYDFGKVTISIHAVRSALVTLIKHRKVIRVNGGYAIYNWMDLA